MGRLRRRRLVVAYVVFGAAAVALASPSDAGVGVGRYEPSSTTTTASTTHHDTFTRVDLEPLHADQTTVTALLDGVPVFDQTIAAPPGSADAQGLVDQATAVLHANGAGAIEGPTTGDVQQSSETVHVGDQLDHTEQTVTVTTSVGPTTISTGEDQSESFFVAGGTTNLNTNIHTEQFIDQLFQDTVTDAVHIELSAATAEVAASTKTNARQLARTGRESPALVALALVLLVFGASLVVFARRLRQTIA